MEKREVTEIVVQRDGREATLLFIMDPENWTVG